MKLLQAVLVFLVLAAPVNACRLALAFALDVSGSVDQTEYRMQLDGLADALSDPDVTAALFAMPDAPVSVAIYEWSSSDYQRLIQAWGTVTDKMVLTDIVNRLRGWTRETSPEATGLGAALRYGRSLFGRGPSCWKTTLDVSGDGKNNDWPKPQDVRLSGLLSGIAINGLVIVREGQSDPESADGLVTYYRARVVQGPDAFVERAEGFRDYARAMRRKLLRELETQPLGRLDTAPQPPTAIR